MRQKKEKLKLDKIFEKIKNKEQFEKAVIDMIDNTKSLEIDDINAKIIGVIININPSSTDYISYEEILRERYGDPYEMFLHIQHEADMPEFIAVIVSGVKMPVEEIEKIYTEYKTRMERVDRNKDDFFAAAKKLELEDDSELSLNKQKTTMKASDFFSKFKKNEEGPKVVVKEDKTSEYQKGV